MEYASESGYQYCTTSFNKIWTQIMRKFKLCVGSNPVRGVSKICDGENLWKPSWPEIRLKNAFCRSTVPQKQFSIIMIIIITIISFYRSIGYNTLDDEEKIGGNRDQNWRTAENNITAYCKKPPKCSWGLTLFRMGAKKRLTPVTSTNVRIRPKNFLTFSCNPFAPIV